MDALEETIKETMDDLRLDGNAAGGLLSELFAFEVTTAYTVCGGCGAGRPLGALLVYTHGMGTIIRCTSCDNAIIRVGHVRGGYRLDLRGLAILQPDPDAPLLSPGSVAGLHRAGEQPSDR